MNELFDNSKRPRLDVYYCIELQKDQDIQTLEKYLRIYLEVHEKQFIIDKFINCNYVNDNVENKDNDVIKNGLMTFNNMMKKLKLKTTNEVWFIYISSGNVNNTYENVSVILLNKEPMSKRCNYIINKSKINVLQNHNKIEKLENLKLFNKSLQELLVTERLITYTNFNE